MGGLVEMGGHAVIHRGEQIVAAARMDEHRQAGDQMARATDRLASVVSWMGHGGKGGDDETVQALRDLQREDRATRAVMEDIRALLRDLDESGSRLISR